MTSHLHATWRTGMRRPRAEWFPGAPESPGLRQLSCGRSSQASGGRRGRIPVELAISSIGRRAAAATSPTLTATVRNDGFRRRPAQVSPA
jgi:hypothetical protein